MKQRLVKLLILFILPLIPFTQITNAILHDTEEANDNFFQAHSLDIELRDDTETEYTGIFFDEGKSETETSLTKEIFVANTGSLDLEYYPAFEFTTGSEDVCDEITLKASLNSVEQFNDTLTDFDLETNEIALSQGNTDQWEFELTHETEDTNLQGQACEFDIVFQAYEDTDTQIGFSDTETLSNTVTLAYEPTLSISHNTTNYQFVMEFGNLQNFQTFDYTLTYDTDTISDGVNNTVILSGEATKTIFVDLGTISDTVLVPHSNPHNFDLSVDLTDVDGHDILLSEQL